MSVRRRCFQNCYEILVYLSQKLIKSHFKILVKQTGKNKLIRVKITGKTTSESRFKTCIMCVKLLNVHYLSDPSDKQESFLLARQVALYK